MKKIEDLKNIADANLEKLDMAEASKARLAQAVSTPKKLNLHRLHFAAIPAAAAVLAFIVFFTGIFSNKAAVVYADNLMKGITQQKVTTVDLNDKFIYATADFSVQLFKQAYTKGKNSLISPTSVYLALGMTANGADGNTLKEFEKVLGRNRLSMSDLNSSYYSLAKELTQVQNGKVSLANSIWYRKEQSLMVKKEFLQTNADYYNASAYESAFDSKTVKDINNWVKSNTGNLIDKIIENIGPEQVMYLINAAYFEDEWLKPYTKADIIEGEFKLSDGTSKTINFMHSEEEGYLTDGKAQGFIKPYKSGKYSFVALLPNEGVNIDDYINSLSGQSFLNLIKDRSDDEVEIMLPKFKEQYEVNLNEPLQNMGLKECFDTGKANFTKMVEGGDNIYLSKVLHKTFITVDEQGTKAAAVSAVEMTALGIKVMPRQIVLNRPFVYAIINNETGLPLFIGTVMNPQT